MKKQVIILAVGLVCVAAFCTPMTFASPVTIYIEAVVDTVEDEAGYLEGQINPGDTITGYYIYESTTPDTNPSVYIGDYEHYTSPYGVFLSVGGFNFETDLENVNFLVSVVNAGGPYTSDDYVMASSKNLALSNGTLVEIISWALSDSTGDALSSDALPLNATVLSDWDFNHLRIMGAKENLFIVDGQVILAIPEPASIFLLGLGSLALLTKRRFR